MMGKQHCISHHEGAYQELSMEWAHHSSPSHSLGMVLCAGPHRVVGETTRRANETKWATRTCVQVAGPDD